jgi:hypothetical protein
VSRQRTSIGTASRTWSTTIGGRDLTGILLARGDGTFTNMPALAAVGALEIGDFNRDQIPDLLVASSLSTNSTQLKVFIGSGDGTFVAGWTSTLAWAFVRQADVNTDGSPDLVLSRRCIRHAASGDPRQTATGTFSAPIVSEFFAGGSLIDVYGRRPAGSRWQDQRERQ